MSQLSAEQIEEIAEKAAEKAVEKLSSAVYREIGKTIVTKFFSIVGLLAIGAALGWQFLTNGKVH
jgi:hypothetical protein